MLVAAYFGEEIAWESDSEKTGLIVSILLIQIIAILGQYYPLVLPNVLAMCPP